MSSTPATKQKTFEQFLSEHPGATTEEWQRWNVSEANTKGKEDMAARERLSQSRDQTEKPVKRSTAKSEPVADHDELSSDPVVTEYSRWRSNNLDSRD